MRQTVFLLCLHVIALPPAYAEDPSVPSPPSWGLPTMDVDAWMTKYAPKPEQSIPSWSKRFGNVYNSWFNGNDDKVAAAYVVTWGPLGIRTRMHDRGWGHESAFRRVWPQVLCDDTGELLVNAFEVIEVLSGSPAEGHLQVGDLLLAIDGKPLMNSVEAFKPLWKFQSTRSLALHAGLLLDQAEGQGKIRFTLLRLPRWKVASESARLVRDVSSEAEFDVDVSNARSIRLVIDSQGKGLSATWANWLRPRLIGDGKEVDLSSANALESRTGWGQVRRGIQVDNKPIQLAGKPVEASLGVHADSVLRFAIPHGMKRFQATLQASHPQNAGFVGRIEILPRVKSEPPPSGWKTLVEKRIFNGPERQAGLTLDAPVQAGMRVRLTVDDGGNGNGGDGFNWLDLRLKGASGERLVSDLLMTKRTTGWSNIKLSNNGQDWWVHANSVLEFTVPKGTWRLLATGRPSHHGTIIAKVEARQIPSLSKTLAERKQEVQFPIPRIGKFGTDISMDNEKVVNIVATQAAWLVRQQHSDGSWPRAYGYTSNHFDTAWAVLGLLATGDPQHESAIRKGAHYLAFSGIHDGWAVPGAMNLLALSEYWLRYRDDQVLPAIDIWVRRLISEMVQGDMTVGHGKVPGYRGGGVSIGGSHVCLALAVANLTPVKVPVDVIDGMLRRVQELAPDGFVPYGRDREHVAFQPNLASGGTYSGRHGPYLIASLIHGGPRLFTENCSAIYRDGEVGGIDQGHATQTLSMMWAFPTAAFVGEKAYKRHLEAMRWKITMLRCYSGGFAHLPYRLEYQGGEGLLTFALRTGGWLVSLCANRHNLAITGASDHRASQLIDLPPVTHRDAVLHGYYLRNWAVAESILDKEAPPALKAGVQSLQKMEPDADLHAQLFAFLEQQAGSVAAKLLEMQTIDPTLRCYLAEMVLGIDHRITLNNEKVNNQPVPGQYQIELTSQHPLSGACFGTDAQARNAWVKRLPFPMEGEVTLEDPDNLLSTPVNFSIDPRKGVRFNGWHTHQQVVKTEGPDKPCSLNAHIRYQVGELLFDYKRPIFIGKAEPWEGPERGRSVVNDRRVWVPGQLLYDHTGWNLSFALPSGQVITAATQGNTVRIEDTENDRVWISPEDGAFTAHSKALFCFTSGWQGFEARVPEVRLLQQGSLSEEPSSLSSPFCQDEMTVDSLLDNNRKTGITLHWSDDSKIGDNVFLEAQLPRIETIRAVSVRLDNDSQLRLRMKALVKGQWQTIWLGNSNSLVKSVIPTQANRLRLELNRTNPNRRSVNIDTWKMFSDSENDL